MWNVANTMICFVFTYSLNIFINSWPTLTTIMQMSFIVSLYVKPQDGIIMNFYTCLNASINVWIYTMTRWRPEHGRLVDLHDRSSFWGCEMCIMPINCFDTIVDVLNTKRCACSVCVSRMLVGVLSTMWGVSHKKGWTLMQMKNLKCSMQPVKIWY